MNFQVEPASPPRWRHRVAVRQSVPGIDPGALKELLENVASVVGIGSVAPIDDQPALRETGVQNRGEHGEHAVAEPGPALDDQVSRRGRRQRRTPTLLRSIRSQSISWPSPGAVGAWTNPSRSTSMSWTSPCF